VHDYYKQREWTLAKLEDPAEVQNAPYLRCLRGSLHCPPQDWDRLVALYRAEVEHLDTGFERLRTALQKAALWNRSVVVFLSDHGEGFDFEHGRTHHGGRLNADQVRIPLIVRVPGVPPRDETVPVSLVDLMPTILELTGAAPVDDLDGRSFAAALGREPPPVEARSLYAMEHHYFWNRDGVRTPGRSSGRHPYAVAVIEGPHWYIRGIWDEELYDMRTDPSQRRNLAEDAGNIDVYRELIARRASRRAAPNAIEPDEELAEQLRSLGYAE
jgi:arylsulfatase A-like enzyme